MNVVIDIVGIMVFGRNIPHRLSFLGHHLEKRNPLDRGFSHENP
jgi:hypothetical protein